jgi:hypothetical protein
MELQWYSMGTDHFRDINNSDYFRSGIHIFILLRRKKNQPTGITGNQEKALGNIKGLVCSMLAQSGGGLRQYEIGANLGLPIHIVSDKLNELEKEGIIKREWKNDEYTYFVSRPKDDETAGDDT